jgi:hypothetical protein
MITHNKLIFLADDVLEKFPDINQGGCCIFAAYVAKQIQQYFKVRVIAFSEDGVSDIDRARPHLKSNSNTEWKSKGCKFNHLAVEITDNKNNIWHYDTSGLFPSDGTICRYYTQLKGALSIDEAIELADNPDGWSSRFNRADIPNIKRLIKDHFSENVKVSWKTKLKTILFQHLIAY